jgi:hypothetical protein
MGLLTKLTTDGSNLSINDGLTPAINPLAVGTLNGGLSIHSDGTPGNSYSLNGSNANIVGNLVSQYQDGITNPLKLPSNLDLQGFTPSQYLNNLPESGPLIGDNNIATPFG